MRTSLPRSPRKSAGPWKMGASISPRRLCTNDDRVHPRRFLRHPGDSGLLRFSVLAGTAEGEEPKKQEVKHFLTQAFSGRPKAYQKARCERKIAPCIAV